jgi:hypothetical protein
MKKFIVVISVLLIVYTLFAQSVSTQQNNSTSTYRLFPTQNMWTLIKLNTRNGQIWQVQYDVQGIERFQTSLSLMPQIAKEQEANDRFTLHPTQNMYTFILLDQFDGRMWQVQWSTEAKKRFIIPIE